MYVIKRTDTDQYWTEWDWNNSKWDGKQFDYETATNGVDFFSTYDIPCIIESL